MTTQGTTEDIFEDVIDRDAQKNLTIAEFLISEDNQLEIPNYQRPYSWDMDNINEYINDIINIVEKEDVKSWFMGSIYVTKLRGDAARTNQVAPVKSLALLDGQQRITTIQIILWNLFFIRKFYLSHIDLNLISDEKLKADYKDDGGLKNLLLKDRGRNAKPRYITHNQLKDKWEEFIKKLNLIDSKNEFETFKEQFCESLLNLQGEPSAKIISEAINKTFKIFKDYIFDKKLKDEYKEVEEHINDSKTELQGSGIEDPSKEKIIENMDSEKIKFIHNFTKKSSKKYVDILQAITDKCWVFKINLVDSNSSLKIFEALNNRGKGLSLTDKLRYKCLVKSSNDKKEEIRKEWKKIYNDLDFLLNNDFIKNEDDLFKTFLNSHTPKDYSKISQLLKVFEQKYLADDSKIILFCKEIQKLTAYHRILLNINSANAADFLKCQDDDKLLLVKALFSTFRQAIYISDNSRLMFYSTIREYYNPEKKDLEVEKDLINNIDNINQNHDKIFNALWNIIKIILCEEIIYNTKSNKARINYLKYGIPDNLSEEVEDFIIQRNIEKIIENIIFAPDARIAGFILYLTSYLSHHQALAQGGIVVPKQQLEREHLLPGAWGAHWSEMKISDQKLKKDIKDYKFKGVSKNDRETALSIFDRNKNLNLQVNTNDPDSKQHHEKSIGQMIGNMFIIHKKLNGSIKNREFAKKKPELKKSLYTSIPNNGHSIIGIDKYDKWDFKTIIERSFEIYDIINKIWDKEWNDSLID